MIGMGHLGKWHFQKLRQLDQYASCAVIVEKDQKKINDIRKKLPSQNVTCHLDRIIKDIDAALVISPTTTHYEIVKLLLEEEKHIFCEKPLTDTLAKAKELERLAEQKKDNVIVQVGHSERYHQIWKEFDSYRPLLGPPCTVRINRVTPFKGRSTDVDVIFDLMIHDLDLLLFLFGERPQTFHSHGYKIRTEKWDYITSELFLPNLGIGVHMTASRSHVKEVRDWEITSEKGCLTIDLLNHKVMVSYHDRNIEEKIYPKRDHLLLEQEDFYLAILNKKRPVVSVQDGVKAIELACDVKKNLEK